MLNNIFSLIVGGALIILSAIEIFRFRRARVYRSEITYPAPRLRRRLAISGVALGLLGVAELDPSGKGSAISLAWILACMTGAWFMLRLVLKDLREASVAALAERRRAQDALEARLRASLQTLAEERSASAGDEADDAPNGDELTNSK